MTDIVIGTAITTFTVMAGAEHTETLTLHDRNLGETTAELSGWLTLPASATADLSRTQRNFTRLAEGLLRRAAEWRPGDPHRPNLVPREDF
ncbi:hypothetical protein [Angustibacter peucedani]